MELALFVYSAGVITKLSVLFSTLIGILVACCVLKIAVTLFSADDYTKKYYPDRYQNSVEALKLKWLKLPATVIILLGLLTAIIPTEKTMYTALAAYVGQSVVQSETADKVLKIVNGKLDEYLVEMDKAVKEEVKK